MTADQTICRVCRLPKGKDNAGLVTQFISVCKCDLIVPEDAALVEICSTCKKPITTSREGTITQFVFSEQRCSCDRPLPVAQSPSSDNYKGKTFAGYLDDDEGEAELDLDPERFPIDRYKPISELGRGASGRVYLCRDKMLGKKVAVKSLLELTAEQLIAFQEEARFTSQLDHPNIVKILDFGASSGGVPYMVMEYVPGISLESLLSREGTLDVEKSMNIAQMLAIALDGAHKQGILHRDIKPSNVLLVETDGALDLRLIDFGVAKVKEATGSLTEYQGKTLAGTPSYMSPDTVLGYGYTPASEVYSIGCILFEMLAGEPPFAGETALEVISQHVNEQSPVIEGVPNALMEVIDSCLSKDPSQRPDGVAELARVLEEIGSRKETDYDESAGGAGGGSKRTAFLSMVAAVFGVCLLIGSFTSSFNHYSKNDEPKSTAADSDRRFARSHVIEDLDQVETFAQPINTPIFKSSDSKSIVGRYITDDFLRKNIESRKEIGNWTFKESELTLPSVKRLGKIGVLSLNFDECSELNDDVFPVLSKFEKLYALSIGSCYGITDQGLENLRSKSLASLSLCGGSFSGKVCKNLNGVPNLEYLSLTLIRLSKTELASLRELKKLRSLVLNNCLGDEDNSLDCLVDFPALKVFSLRNTKLTKDKLESLSKLGSLTNLVVNNCATSDSDLKYLQEALPNVEIDVSEYPKYKYSQEFKDKTVEFIAE